MREPIPVQYGNHRVTWSVSCTVHGENHCMCGLDNMRIGEGITPEQVGELLGADDYALDGTAHPEYAVNLVELADRINDHFGRVPTTIGEKQ